MEPFWLPTPVAHAFMASPISARLAPNVVSSAGSVAHSRSSVLGDIRVNPEPGTRAITDAVCTLADRDSASRCNRELDDMYATSRARAGPTTDVERPCDAPTMPASPWMAMFSPGNRRRPSVAVAARRIRAQSASAAFSSGATSPGSRGASHSHASSHTSNRQAHSPGPQFRARNMTASRDREERPRPTALMASRSAAAEPPGCTPPFFLSPRATAASVGNRDTTWARTHMAACHSRLFLAPCVSGTVCSADMARAARMTATRITGDSAVRPRRAPMISVSPVCCVDTGSCHRRRAPPVTGSIPTTWWNHCMATSDVSFGGGMGTRMTTGAAPSDSTGRSDT